MGLERGGLSTRSSETRSPVPTPGSAASPPEGQTPAFYYKSWAHCTEKRPIRKSVRLKSELKANNSRAGMLVRVDLLSNPYLRTSLLILWRGAGDVDQLPLIPAPSRDHPETQPPTLRGTLFAGPTRPPEPELRVLTPREATSAIPTAGDSTGPQKPQAPGAPAAAEPSSESGLHCESWGEGQEGGPPAPA